MKKILKSALCIALAAMLLAAVPLAGFAANTVTILRVTEDGARLRSADKEIITSLSAGTKVFYMDEKLGSNSKVRVSNGLEGYIYDEFLASYGSARLDNIYYASAAKGVYRTPSTDDRRIATISENQYVIVLRTHGGWAFVKNLDGNGGFCTLDGLVKAS